MDFCALTERILRNYFSGTEEETRELLRSIDPECVIIGTGGHEFYLGSRPFLLAMEDEVKERENIAFSFKDFWCEEKRLSEDVCLVYGKLYLWWESEDRKVRIDMDSRFSILYRRREDGWKIVHVHQSLPNPEQMEGEYYPKTLTEQVKEVTNLADQMRRLAQKDGLTGVINYRAFEELWDSASKEDGWLFLIDLDNFKEINDTFGHIAGNHVLKSIAGILQSSVRTGDVVCRMGGDEFILLCEGLGSEGKAELLAERILKDLREGRKNFPEGCWPTASMGAAPIGEAETLEKTLGRADEALYRVKREGKSGWQIWRKGTKI